MNDPTTKPNKPKSARTNSRAAGFRRLFLFFVFLVLVVAYPTLRRWSVVEDGQRHSAVGRQLTQVPLHPLQPDKAPVTAQQLAGQVVLINYWGTWCFPCRLELPHLAELHRRWHEEPNVRFLFVSCEDNLSLAELTGKTLDFLEREGHALPVYADPGQASRRHLAEVAELGDGFAYPTTVILDGELRIRGLWRGYREEDTAAQAGLIEQLVQ
jgi:cytochrome c biogenesis protein CcmG, thiol:disulfide interchange protein DsbE